MGWLEAARLARAALIVVFAVSVLVSEALAGDFQQEDGFFELGFQEASDTSEPEDQQQLTRAERKALKQARQEEEAQARAAAKEAEKAEQEEARLAKEREKQAARDEKAAEKARRQEEKRRQREGIPEPTGLRLQAIDVDQSEEETRVSIRVRDEPKWLVGEGAAGGVALRVFGATADEAISPFLDPGGLVEGIEVTVDWKQPEPSTVIEIATRSPVMHSVRQVDDRIEIRIRPSARVVEASNEGDSSTSQPTSAAGAVTSVSPTEFDASFHNSEYSAGPGDVLAIEVFGLPELSRQLRVESTGTINYPLLGQVDVLGLSLQEVETKLAELLSSRGLVNDPVVVIAIEELVSRGVSIQGAVNQPGVFQLYGPKNLLELLVETGGLAKGEAAGRSIYVIRRTRDGLQLRTEIDTEQLFEQGDMTLNIALQPGDIIQVPRPQRFRVFVSGAVRTPGPIDYLGNERLTLLQAITSAGGPTERARLSAVQVIRRLEDGSEERFVLDVKKISNGKLEDFPLERGDTIVLKDWFF